tara:strand:+ start:3318 stop:6242 length:2925 start_codon:yes stop_codon:yes gene_type:complete
MTLNTSKLLYNSQEKKIFFPLKRDVFFRQTALNKNGNQSSTNKFQELLSSLNGIPDYIKNDGQQKESENVFAVFSVYVTFLDGKFKLIINNFGNGFFYTDKIYQFDLSHYTNFGHVLEFARNESLNKNYQVVREGIPGTSGAYIKIKPLNNDLIYIYTALQGLPSGSFYNPINTLPNTDLPTDFVTITVTVEFINNSFQFVFDNYSDHIICAKKQFKFDVSNPTNSGFYLKFSKDDTSKQVYNTISIGTPGTKNACVYFYAHSVTSIYIFDENTGYSAGCLYNPLFTYNKNINRDILINKQVVSGTNSSFGKGMALGNTNLAITTSYNSWSLHDISNVSASEIAYVFGDFKVSASVPGYVFKQHTVKNFNISSSEMGCVFKSQFDHILCNSVGITNNISGDAIALLKSSVLSIDEDGLLNTVLQKINVVDDLYEFPYDTLFTQYARNIYIDDSDLLVSCSNINNIYSLFKYSKDDSSMKLTNFYETKSLYFGDCIVKFQNEYICGAHGSNCVQRLDLSLNPISSITFGGECQFGKQLACNSDFLFVSAPYYNNSQGCVLCYDKNISLVQTITINDSIKLGSSISLSPSNTLIIGGKNIAYEYLYNGETFIRTHDFHPPESTTYDISGTSIYENFGNKVIVDSDNYVYISASYLNHKSGVVYIYKRMYNTQVQIQKITTNDMVRNDEFGHSMVLNQNHVIIFSKNNNGQAYIYDRKHADEYQSEIEEDTESEKTKLLGSIMFDEVVNSGDNNPVISVWTTAPENVRIPSIDVSVEKTITIFYDLLNQTVLNSSNELQLSLSDSIKLYRDASFQSILDIFTSTNNHFSLALGKVRESAYAALTNDTQLYFADKTYGICITTEEYNILNNYISSLHKTVDGITNSIRMYNDFMALRASIVAYKISYDILNDTTKLYEFIKSKQDKNSLSGLNVTTTLTVNPKLQSHIQMYVSLYGWPDDFIFDSDLMAQILVNENSI